MSGLYCIFDTTLRCDFLLPELPSVTAGEFSLSVRMGEGDSDQFGDQGFALAFEWRNHDGRVVCWCERKTDEFLFVFPAAATFHITSKGLISCFLHENATMQMLRHLLLNQIIPRYLATTGKLVLHAGAVRLKNGQSVAFLGNSGFGKSTLVSSFHRNGALLINDDCIMLEIGENGVMMTGGLVGIRLFPDSVNAVFSESAGFTNYTTFTDKQQLILKTQVADAHAEPFVLDAMFVLNDLGESSSNEVSIQTVSGSEAMMTMIYSAFSLDPSDRQMIVGNFNNVGKAIGDRLKVYSLQYPRKHAFLDEVRAVVERTMMS